LSQKRYFFRKCFKKHNFAQNVLKSTTLPKLVTLATASAFQKQRQGRFAHLPVIDTDISAHVLTSG
jgi:hypothetical protein